MTVLHAERLLPGVADWMDELVAIRHDLHQNPELGFETERTVGKICEHLRAFGVDEIDTELVKGCVVAVVKGDREGARSVFVPTWTLCR